ncbi:hypothetical protein [Lipingzhangella rawalii]|uniref:hypothetical protein n=1 Tax=Lipingzhangella rawalii TaxID=2055835 RepID=UPI00287BBC63|nr:hypothetical protein [Lipingzhangella rawalii]
MLAVARTFTHAVVLLEALAVFRGDPRVQIRFTCDDTSAFHRGTAELLRRHGIEPVAWPRARELPTDLVLTTSENIDLTGFSVPVVVLPHGVGFQKYVPDTGSRGRRISGIPRPEFLDWSNLRMALAHPVHREQLRTVHSGLAARATVVGDLLHERIQASRRLRWHYRSHLGLDDSQHLVALSSTWGPSSLLGSRPDLPERLLAHLPMDGYRVAAIVHPNTWFWHDAWQLRQILGRARDAGLILVPPEAGWGATLVAADCLLGDHGSVTLHGAALDLPVLLGGSGKETVPGTASASLAEVAPRLDTDGDLRHQVTAASTGHPTGRFREATASAFTEGGAALHQLTELLYELLRLPQPVQPRTIRTLPAPAVEASSACALHVHTWWQDTDVLGIERFPAFPYPASDPPGGRLQHLAVVETAEMGTDDTLTHLASVIVCEEPQPLDRAGHWVRAALDRYPGSLLVTAAADRGYLAGVRGRGVVRCMPATTAHLDAITASALVYALLRGRRPLAGSFRLRVGEREQGCTLSPENVVHTSPGPLD